MLNQSVVKMINQSGIFLLLCVVILFLDNVDGRGAEYFQGFCKKFYTRYRTQERCDNYIECIRGVPYERSCSDGQYFYNITQLEKDPCEYLDTVLCGNRFYSTQSDYRRIVPLPLIISNNYHDSLCLEQFLQPKLRLGDKTSCNEYVECSQGKLYNKKCDPELAFDPVQHTCVWPGESSDCDAPAFCSRLGKGYNYETKMCTVKTYDYE